MKYLPLILLPLSAVAGDLDMDEIWIEEPVEFEGVTLVGMDLTSENTSEVDVMWGEFIPCIGTEIPVVGMDEAAYGVLLAMNMNTGAFSYLAAVSSDMPDPLPEGMIRWEIDPGTYAVFHFPFTKLSAVYEYVYGVWFGQSGYTHGASYDFEYYPPGFNPDTEGVIMQLYVSIKDMEGDAP